MTRGASLQQQKILLFVGHNIAVLMFDRRAGQASRSSVRSSSFQKKVIMRYTLCEQRKDELRGGPVRSDSFFYF